MFKRGSIADVLPVICIDGGRAARYSQIWALTGGRHGGLAAWICGRFSGCTL